MQRLIIPIAIAIIFGVAFFSFSLQDTYKIAITTWGTPPFDSTLAGFKDAIQESNISKKIEYVEINSHADSILLIENVNTFEEKNVDMYFTLGTTISDGVKNLISDTPIVFSAVSYPVEVGLIESMESSGNNLVGTTNWVSPKIHLQTIQKINPNVSAIGFLFEKNILYSTIQYNEFIREPGFEDVVIHDLSVSTAEEIEQKMANHEVDVFFLACDRLMQTEGESIVIEYAQKLNTPIVSCHQSTNVDAYSSVSWYDMGYRSGELAAQIINGKQPSELNSSLLEPVIKIN